MDEAQIKSTFAQALAARRTGDHETAVKLLTSVSADGRHGAALAMTAGRILLHDLNDPERASACFARASSQAPRSRAAMRLSLLSRFASNNPLAARDREKGPRLAIALVLAPFAPDTMRTLQTLPQDLVSELAALVDSKALMSRLDLQVIDATNVPRCWPEHRLSSVVPLTPPQLLSAALENAAMWLRAQLAEHERHNVASHRPWIVCLIDSLPKAGEIVSSGLPRAVRDKYKAKVMAVVTNPDTRLDLVEPLVGTPPLRLVDSDFKALVRWLAESLRRVLSCADVGARTELPAPTWGAWKPPGSAREVRVGRPATKGAASAEHSLRANPSLSRTDSTQTASRRKL